MTDLNVRSDHTSSQYGVDAGNISIKKKSHVQVMNQQDKVERAQTQREEFVPPADYPVLDPHNENASSAPRKGHPSANGTFAKNMEKGIQNLSDKQLEGLTKKGLTPQEAKNLLTAAFNRPGANLDPAVIKLLNQLSQNAAAATRLNLGLSSDWQPESSKASDAQLAQDYLQNFSAQLDDQNLSEADKDALTYAHFNPSSANSLPENLQSIYQDADANAQQETLSDNGLPAGTQLPNDGANFNKSINTAFTDNFLSELENRASEEGLSEKDVAQLKTMLYSPQSNVPDKAKLMSLFNSLAEKATKDTTKEFNLPAGVHLKSAQGESYHTALNSAFRNQFKENAAAKFGLSPDKLSALLATKGLSAANLPPELKAAFESLQNLTMAQITEKFGLPSDWKPGKKDAISEVGGKERTEETGEAEEEKGAEATAGGLNTRGTHRKQNVRSAKGEGARLGEIPSVSPRNEKIAHNLLNFTSSYSKSVSNFTQKYASGPEWLTMGNAMMAVSSALDGLRSMIYQCQIRESLTAQTIARMQQSIQTDRANLAQAKANEARAHHPKTCFIFKILDKIPGVGQLCSKLLKIAMWCLDTLTGGAITMICKAAGMEPLGENPLLMMHMISPAQAAKMDMAMQIIAMVVEMAISVILAQPEMVMAIVAELSMVVAEAGAEVAMEVGSEVATQLVEKTVAEATETVTDQLATKGVEVGVKDASKALGKEITEVTRDAIKMAVKKSMQESMDKALEQGLKTAVKQAEKDSIKAAQKASTKWVEKEADRIVDKAFDSAIEDASKNVSKNVGKSLGKAGAEEAANTAAKTADEAADVLKEGADIVKQNEKEYAKSMKRLLKETRKEAGKVKMRSGSIAMDINDIVQGLLQVIGNVIQIPQHIKQAKVDLELAKLSADMTELDTDYKQNQVVLKNVLDSMDSMGKWVDQINKQEAAYWKKMQIHFIAA